MGPLARARIHSIVAASIIGVVLFVSSGDLAWWPAWIYMIFLVFGTILPLAGPFRLDEGLIEERMSRKPGAKRWDRYFVALVGIFTIAELIVPGLDHRLKWSLPQPMWKLLFGLALVILGTAGLIWAMRANRFFSAIIRIQQDRGHQVVDTGPYRIVRHPGYAFLCLRAFGLPLLFGSNPAFIVAGLYMAMFVVRTVLEDRVLQKELIGYKVYSEQVTWKLVRGIW